MIREQLREKWQPPVTGPAADAELQRIRGEWIGHAQGTGSLGISQDDYGDDYGDHGDDIAWLLDCVATFKAATEALLEYFENEDPDGVRGEAARLYTKAGLVLLEHGVIVAPEPE